MPRAQELRGTSRLRTDVLPTEALVLLRGGPQELEELLEQAEDCGVRYLLDGQPFFALSVVGVLEGDREEDVMASMPLLRYKKLHRVTVGELAAAGFSVWATFRSGRHFSVRLPEASPAAVGAFLAVAGPPVDNPRYRGEDGQEVQL